MNEIKNLFFGIMMFLLAIPVIAQQNMDISQTLSDGAQRNTIAFSGLAFVTGEKESYTFLPPGKLSDYFGFQYMRDNDPDEMGHNTDFVTKSANNMLALLSDEQKNELIALSKTQVALINDYGYKRFPLIDAFYRLLNKEMPDGCTALDSTEIMNYSAIVFNVDGVISYQRAKLFGSIYRSLSQEQKNTLDDLFAVGMLSWPDLDDQIDKTTMTHEEHVAVMTYASEMFAWFAGDTEADVYFCPERQATYFGGFYMKDIPAMGNPNYSIDVNITQEKGISFLNTLNETQKKQVTDLVEIQWETLNGIVDVRTEISNELRKFRTQESIDSLKVIELSEHYGQLDGYLAYLYASAFAKAGWTLTEGQHNTLLELRDLDDYPATKPFLFSDEIDWPEMINTDFFFKTTITGLLQLNTGNLSGCLYPNPVVRNCTFKFQLDKKQKVQVLIHNISGQKIWETPMQEFEPGTHQINWNKTDLSVETVKPGIYLCTIQYGSSQDTLKFTIQ